MKYLHRLAFVVASAAFFIASSALAQSGTVTNHAFAIGKGPGVQGYTSLLCASAQLAVGQSAADPVCQTITGDVTINASGVTAIGANKVTNTQLATMPANTTKCNATGATANPTDCTASDMRTNLGLVIGTNVEAWDADLDCLAGLSATGIIRRTGAGTCSAGTIALSDLAAGTQDTVVGYFGSTAASALAINNCSSALTYSTSTHTFGCNASPGGGTVTEPGGRLTLVSGQPVMSADTTSQTLYYAPYSGNTVPIYDGTAWASHQFTATATDQVGLSLALGGSANWPAGTIFDVFAIDNGGTIELATRAWDSSMLPSYTQISNSTNAVITTGTSTGAWTQTSAAFDGTLSKTASASAIDTTPSADLNNCIGQDYGAGHSYVLTKVALTEPSNGSFRGSDPTTEVISTYGSNDNTNWQRLDPSRNVLSSSATYGHTYTYYINTLDAEPYRYHEVCWTGSGSSSDNLHIAQIQFFTTTTPSTRRLALYNGIPVNDATATMRISATSTLSVSQYEGTYLGSVETDAGTAGQITADFGYGINRVMDIWNYYHRQKVTLVAGIPATASGLPASVTYRYNLAWPANQDWAGVQSSTDYSVQVLVGYTGDDVTGKFKRAWYIQGTPPSSYEFGIGVDTTISFSGSEGGLTGDATGSTALGYYGATTVTLSPFFGTHTLYGIEKLTYAPSGTVSAFDNIGNTGLYVHTSY